MTKSTEKWQVRFSNSILGVKVAARRSGRGPWLHNSQIPEHVRAFCFLEPHSKDRPQGQWVMERATYPNLDALEREAREVRWQRPGLGCLRGWIDVPAPPRPPKPRKIPHSVPAIRSLAQLCDHFGADEPRGLNRRIYKDTECGASISVYLPDGSAIHNGSKEWNRLTRRSTIRGFTIQTTVEGSEATVDSDEFILPVAVREVDEWIKDMEAEADAIWTDANRPDEDPEVVP